jgi:AraC-like DNA-binding protein
MKKLEYHELAQMLPLMNEPDCNELAANMKEVGQQVPIVLFEGKILDGRNRYRACEKLGIEPRIAHYNKDQARDYVISQNLYRRHYSRFEKNGLLMRLIAKQESLDMTNKEVAQTAGVSKRTVQRAKRKTVPKPPVLSPPSDGEIVDENGTLVPPPARFYWDRIPEAKMVLGQLRAAKAQVKKLLPDDPMWVEAGINGVLGDLGSAINRFSTAIPAYVCPYCKGLKPESCSQCKGRGCMSEFAWNFVPEELKPKK